ncbi:S8 family serine peptidase [Virgibacillus oceani]|uniref:Minor extracellular protease vpr n=1 Tax=Virgibacillus oceani TaxID=1479511 RepID=A0A917M9G9_9BACI|nr:S8 family serine peptidase [Virgibacillus oceani]GGG86266.1 minor extracellular protease vpr [Virgibacillus oceani]
MRCFLVITTILATLFMPTIIPAAPSPADMPDEKVSIIIEVEGDPEKHKEYLEAYYPYVDVVATYDKLFNGIALQGDPGDMARMDSLDFIKAIHPVSKYEAIYQSSEETETSNSVIPASINDTDYTGEGVKVGIIDTGIDYNHPDLSANFVDGYDLVDLDDDPMETIASQGMPTLHGTHVAGIIAADGKIKGVAPDADIYAYRALGPGGMGTSVQVIAALEQAVEDGMDVINLSLGNSVNGPDYPTSIAVNRAVNLGVAVVIANGNSGPKNWTVGSPATAAKAMSVGASTMPQKVPYLYEPAEDVSIGLTTMLGSPAWTLEKDYPIVQLTDQLHDAHGKIVLIQRGKIPFYEKAKKAQEIGAVAAVIYNNEEGYFQGSVENDQAPLTIPVAAISKEAGEWIMEQSKVDPLYLESIYKETMEGVAGFSSRGPVAVNWDIKPDVIAPGANILSTVPGGYKELQGTSMAAPHVTGAIALLKEAHPNWSVEQITGALKTTAQPIQDDHGTLFEPIVQGMGQIQPELAVNTETIIYEPLLSFGKINDYKETNKLALTIENTSNHEQRYSFEFPKKEKGISWNLPQTFTLKKNEQKTIPVELSVVTQQLKDGIHEGWLKLNQGEEVFHLPYLFVSKQADNPKAMGFQFLLKPFSDDTYLYQLYLTEQVKQVNVNLYNPDTLLYEREFLEIEDPKAGMNEGNIKKQDIGEPGIYKALITLELENGTYDSYETEIQID